MSAQSMHNVFSEHMWLCVTRKPTYASNPAAGAELIASSRFQQSIMRFDDASEFGKSSSFIAYCTQDDIDRERLPLYTHIQNARAEGAIRICKEHVR